MNPAGKHERGGAEPTQVAGLCVMNPADVVTSIRIPPRSLRPHHLGRYDMSAGSLWMGHAVTLT